MFYESDIAEILLSGTISADETTEKICLTKTSVTRGLSHAPLSGVSRVIFGQGSAGKPSIF